MTLADRLRAARLARGLTQHELSVKCGVSLTVVRDLEQGRSTNPRVATLAAIARCLGLKLDDLYPVGGGNHPC